MRRNGSVLTRKKTAYDLVLIAGFLLICLAGMLMVRGSRRRVSDGSDLLVKVSLAGSEYGRYPLATDRDIDIEGHNRLVIRNGEAFMKEADCPDQICMGHRPIRRPGEDPIICLPHKLIVEITGPGPEESSGFDGFTR